MQQIRIHSAQTSVTSVPNCFIDLYMADASGEFIKVYLYLLRWETEPSAALTLTSIADHLYMTENDILRALKYWQSKSLLSLSFTGDALSEIRILPLEQTEAEQSVMPSKVTADSQTEFAPEIPEKIPSRDSRNHSMEEICHFIESHGEDHLIPVLSRYMGHPLSQTELSVILYFSEDLGFSSDLIEYLFEYCISIGHRSFHYIEKVAINWAEQGVSTVDQAKAASTFFTKTDYAVLKAYGISGRRPAKQEVEHIRRWTDQYGFSEAMVLEACARTISAIHNPSFEYTEKILKNWFEHKLFTIEDVKAADAARQEARKAKEKEAKKPADTKNRFNRFAQRSYDYDSLEQKLAKKLTQCNR